MNIIHIAGSYSPQPPNPEHQIGPVLETALQRAPILYIQAGKLQSAVTRYRYFSANSDEIIHHCKYTIRGENIVN
jgi:hypothetical protein